jgi:uncharacterized membrane protein
MKSKILNELPELLEHKVISVEVASNITHYYKTKAENQPNKLFTIFGVLGSALVGLGIILILAHNWDAFSKSIKTFFAFLPLVFAQIVTGFVILKNKSQTWKESSGTLLFFTIGASIALVSQIYNIPGNLSEFLLTWIVLGLPLIYLLNSKAVAILSIVFASYYACVLGYGFSYGNKIPWFYILMLLSIVPFYITLLRKSTKENSTAIFNWLFAISLTVTLGTFINNNWPLGFVMYVMLFGAFYNLGKIPLFDNQKLRRNSYLLLGSLGTVVILIILSFNFLWSDIVRDKITLLSNEGFVVLVLFIIALSLLLYSRRKDELFNLFQYAFILFAILFFIGISSDGLGAILTNILVIALGLFAIKIGTDTFRFSVLNYGLLIITAVIICRFFDTDMSFVLRGILFVAVGIGFFLTNYIMLQKQKQMNNKSLN